MAFTTVPVGPYTGFTEAQLRTRIAAVLAAIIARPVGQSFATSVSGNSMSVSFDPRIGGSKTLEQEMYDLKVALAMVDDDEPEFPTETKFAA